MNYVTVPPASEIALKIKCNQFYADQDVILTAVPGAQFRKFAIGNSICHVDRRGNSFCRLLNHSNRPIKIQPSEILGQVERMDRDACCLVDVALPDDPQCDGRAPSDEELRNFGDKMKFNINPALPDELRLKLLAILFKRKEAFVTKEHPLGFYNRGEVDLPLKNGWKAAYRRPFPHKAEHRPLIQEQVDLWLKQDVIEPSSDFQWNCPIFLINRPSLKAKLLINEKPTLSDFRCISDMRSANEQLETQVVFTPPCRSIIDDVARFSKSGKRAHWFTSFDLRGAYSQIGVKASSRPCLSFQDSEGRVFRHKRLNFGISQAPAIFNNLMISMLSGIKKSINLRNYLDDVILFDFECETQLLSIDVTLSTLIAHGLRCSVEKTNFLMNDIKFLGVHITKDGVQIPDSVHRTLTMLEQKPLRTKKDVLSFIGFVTYWRLHIKNLCERSKHLRKLTLKDTPFVFTEECKAEQKDLIQGLRDAVPLQPINIYKRIYLLIDSSTVGTGIIVAQTPNDLVNDDKFIKSELAHIRKNLNTTLKPIYFLSYAVGRHQARFSSCDIELSGLCRAMQFLEEMGIRQKVTIVSDNLSCVNFRTLKFGSNRIRRQIAYLQRFQFDICYLDGKSHIASDYLSRSLTHLPESERLQWMTPEVDLDDEIFQVSESSPPCHTLRMDSVHITS